MSAIKKYMESSCIKLQFDNFKPEQMPDDNIADMLNNVESGLLKWIQMKIS